MGAHVMVLPPASLEIRAGGLPIRLLAEDAIRRARALIAARAETVAPVPAPAPAPAPEPRPAGPAAAAPAQPAAPAAPPVTAPAAVPLTARGFSLTELYLEAVRHARELEADYIHLEGLACGRTYGDRSIAAADLLIPESYRRAAAEAKRRAEMAGATADFLRGMVDGDGPYAAALASGHDV